MAVQPDTRRLAVLSDLAGFLTSAAFTALRGAPSGLATLGADGVLPAAQLPAGIGGSFAVKPADTSRASTTTQTDDPDLKLSLGAGLYSLELAVVNSGGTIANAKLGVTAGALTQLGAGVSVTGTVLNAPAALGTLVQLGTGATRLWATVRLSSAAVLSLQWAQSTTSTTASTLAAGSWLRVQRLSS